MDPTHISFDSLFGDKIIQFVELSKHKACLSMIKFRWHFCQHNLNCFLKPIIFHIKHDFLHYGTNKQKQRSLHKAITQFFLVSIL